MQTVGYYCPECQMKYVRHKCKEGTLPCEHNFSQAIFVYAKYFGKSGSESVEIIGTELNIRVWLSKRRNGPFGGELGYKVETAKYGEIWMIDYIKILQKNFGSKYVQAFLKRWDSFTGTPLWREFELMSDEQIKEAKDLWHEYKNKKLQKV